MLDADGLPRLLTPRLCLEHLRPRHAAAIAAFLARNEAHLAPWDPPRPPGHASAAYWRAQATAARRDHRAGRMVRWVVLPRPSGAGRDLRVIGRVNLTGIERGPFLSGRLGYQIDAAHEGQGLMREALAAVIAHAFGVLGLHRIEANYRPENERSGRLLARLGFEVIGRAPDYLFIDGAWREHVLTQRIRAADDG